MAHKTLIGGTAYDTKGGKCLVGGTVYSIKKGRTLVGGAGYDVSFSIELDPVFSNNSWENIIAACQSRAVPETWAIADSKAMTVEGVDYLIDIIGKDHDTYASGGTAPLTFQFHDCYGTKYPMNSTHTTVGGWKGCEMRTKYLPIILDLMPETVKNAIREVIKISGVGATSSESDWSGVESTNDKLFLPSEIEILNTASRSVAGEGTQYDYYKTGGSPIKFFDGSVTLWRGRSPYSSRYFVTLNHTGDVLITGIAGHAANAYGVAPCFCF